MELVAFLLHFMFLLHKYIWGLLNSFCHFYEQRVQLFLLWKGNLSPVTQVGKGEKGIIKEEGEVGIEREKGRGGER